MIRHKAVYRGGSGEIVEKKSRFIANIKSVETGRRSTGLYRRDEEEVLGCQA